ncbi:hypothetical protein X801_09215, partial [Opisthorchis viverrini]
MKSVPLIDTRMSAIEADDFYRRRFLPGGLPVDRTTTNWSGVHYQFLHLHLMLGVRRTRIVFLLTFVIGCLLWIVFYLHVPQIQSGANLNETPFRLPDWLNNTNALTTNKGFCSSTRQSASSYVVDDTGSYCPRTVLLNSGCCPTPVASDHADTAVIVRRFVCDSCNQARENCCQIYEHCVSCCMNRQHVQLWREALLQAFELPAQRHLLLADGLFQYCQAKCRTSSQPFEKQKTAEFLIRNAEIDMKMNGLEVIIDCRSPYDNHRHVQGIRGRNEHTRN